MQSSSTNTDSQVKLPCWFWLLIITVCGATGLLVSYVLQHETTIGWPSFDALAALFSGLAFVGLLGALHVQREELKIQKQELIETREVLLQTAQANRESAELAAENLRFQYLVAYIERHKEKLDKINDIKNKLFRQMQTIRNRYGFNLDDDISKLLNEKDVVFSDVRAIKDYIFYHKYIEYERELDTLILKRDNS